MDTMMVINFYSSREVYKRAEQDYIARRKAIQDMLIESLPDCGEGIVAAELSEQSGLESTDIANLLSEFKCGKKLITKTYVLLKDDGTIDYNHKVAKSYRANTYRRP